MVRGRGSRVGGPGSGVGGPGSGGPGSGGPVGPGVRAAGLEVGAQRAPRLLVLSIIFTEVLCSKDKTK